ncbi:DUF805 domain-containing protein [Tropicibacter sp. R15_0]|uniref:DUF805 domain-containing protein n=1 Tax=Tropicibacter sp. R15_0 TaxID=2821101 RepID=UPI001ADAD85E|nr:DUF805 domain-containing protein [Tropicibacter sp. R15_0]MBO9466381.1 DUF805 domain-containing protein [Tropicibacter sp. R15_0]
MLTVFYRSMKMIGPHTAFENYIFRALNITGRATRAEFWWVQGILLILGILAVGFDLYTIATADVPNYSIFAYMTPVLIIVTIVPTLTLTVRRLHDAGRSGMWYFVNSIPIVGPIWLFVLLCLPSESEENKWGQPPNGAGGPWAAPRARGFEGLSGEATETASASKPHDARQGYATLLKLHQEPSAEELEAQRAQVSDYYRTRVLGQAIS